MLSHVHYAVKTKVHYDAKTKEETRELSAGQRGTQEAEYLLLLPPVRGARKVFNLQGLNVVTIGRRLENTISLNDPKCSRVHCELSRASSDQRWTLHDMNSSNGTFVNERRLACMHLLADGDVIQIGDIELVFTVAEPTAT
jgi:pSer/pThr/pTyr-binding forkhead associated (FHA) protein